MAEYYFVEDDQVVFSLCGCFCDFFEGFSDFFCDCISGFLPAEGFFAPIMVQCHQVDIPDIFNSHSFAEL